MYQFKINYALRPPCGDSLRRIKSSKAKRFGGKNLEKGLEELISSGQLVAIAHYFSLTSFSNKNKNKNNNNNGQQQETATTILSKWQYENIQFVN